LHKNVKSNRNSHGHITGLHYAWAEDKTMMTSIPICFTAHFSGKSTTVCCHVDISSENWLGEGGSSYSIWILGHRLNHKL